MTADTSTTVIACCSFCLKPNTQVAKLVAGHGVYICNECVALCQEIIDNKPASVPQLASWQYVTDVDTVLVSLPHIAQAADRVEETLTRWVLRGRELGATWARIGAALGVTRQSAWARFSGEE
jgi:hypothetical protein